MALLMKKLADVYFYIDHDLSDPRTRCHTIILNPFFICGFLYLYHKLIKIWGPRFMEKREPYKLEKVMIVYNLFQICISLYISIQSIRSVWTSGYYSLVCQPLSTEDTPKEREILYFVWLYYIVKILDLLDTIFFILRKKNTQVTFLHVYHHIAMVLLGYVSLKYIPAAHGAALGIINTMVHSVMYTYYLLTCYYPEYKKIWWKKHLTQIQITQFVILLVHFTHILFRPSCAYPKWVSLAFLPQNLFMTFMFTDFYIKEYIKKKQK